MDLLFFGIPDELCRDQLLPFFSIAEIARLDAATHNKKLRNSFHKKIMNIEFHEIPVELDTPVAVWLASRHVHLKKLHFSQEATELDVITLRDILPYVIDLDLSYCKTMPSSALEFMAQRRMRLTSLCLRYCILCTDKVFETFDTDLDSLTTLDVSDCPLISDDTLVAISNNCTSGNLRTLILAGCRTVSDFGVVAVAETVPSLVTLDLADTDITDTGLRAIAQNLSRLRILDLQYCTYLTDVGMHYLARHATQLTSINLGNCRGLTDEGLLPFVSACHSLTSFGVADCASITGAVLEQLAESNPGLLSCDVSYTKMWGDGLANLAACCPALQRLNISYCYELSTESIVSLLDTCEQLQALDFAANTQVTESVVRALCAKSRPALQELSLCYCGGAVNDAIVGEIVRCCPALTALNLAHCTAISDSAVFSLAIHCPGLRFLDISHCPMVTDASLQLLRTHCPLLQALEVIKCTRITAAAIDEMIELTDAAVTC